MVNLKSASPIHLSVSEVSPNTHYSDKGQQLTLLYSQCRLLSLTDTMKHERLLSITPE